MTQPSYDAIVPAGSAARRLGGIDKTTLDVGGRTIIDRVLQAVSGATTVVVVGGPRPQRADVVWTREAPPGSGPAAAVRAGLQRVGEPFVAVVAADLPFVTAALVDQMVASIDDDGAVAVDPDGHPQWLLSAWRVAALQSSELRPDGSMKAALGSLHWRPVHIEDSHRLLDCDTDDDLRRARELCQ